MKQSLFIVVILITCNTKLVLADQGITTYHLTGANPASEGLLFSEWINQFKSFCMEKGVLESVFDRAFEGVEPKYSLPDLIYPDQPQRDHGQPEFLKSPESYLNEKYFRNLESSGLQALEDYKNTMDFIEGNYFVDRYTVIALWGRETAHNNYKLKQHAITALATQAYAGRRFDFFQSELLVALQLLTDGKIVLEHMASSWAGAMGPTQLIPSDYLKYAVDGNADGMVDPWTTIPDALASAANQLAANGWKKDAPWAVEVTVPVDFDCSLATPENIQDFHYWSAAGVVPIADHLDLERIVEIMDNSALLMPAGRKGPVFLTTGNYRALIKYNRSELYAIFVGHLADRLAGRGLFAGQWIPVEPLSEQNVVLLQKLLQREGLYEDKIDGKAGSRTRAAVGKMQERLGVTPDCWPTEELLRIITTTVQLHVP